MSPAEAKNKLLELIGQGYSVDHACNAVGKSQKTYEYYKKTDEGFRNAINAYRDGRRAAAGGVNRLIAAGSFERFSEEFLGQKVFPHQGQWVDLLEGKPPRFVHRAINYIPGQPEYVLCNTPPEHSKSTCITINYVTYRICTDPNIRIIIVSKTLEKAKEFIFAIKSRLTHPRYAKLQVTFGGEGFKEGASVWKADRFYLGDAMRDSGEKDPTIQALGVRGQIYGSRADLIVMDDCITLENVYEYEKQIRWIQQEVLTRIGPGGKLLVVGTRVDAVDLYKELPNPERYPSGESPWTVLTQPAVLEFDEDPNRWVTLWPRADVPWPQEPSEKGEDGLYPRWDGPHLYRRRAVIDPRTWAMVYMQADVHDDATFPSQAVKDSVNGLRKVGPMVAGAPGHRREGKDGLHIIGGFDPAIAGDAAAVVYAVDTKTCKRYVMDVKVRSAPTPDWIRNTIKDLTAIHGIHEWRIEKNAFQAFLTQDPEIVKFLANKGVLLREHVTGKNKWDPDFGVASMASLFSGGKGNTLIELPSTVLSEGTKMLIEQLIVWRPRPPGTPQNSRAKTDTVMALWFCEIRARELIEHAHGSQLSHLPNKFLNPAARRGRVVVNLDEYFARQLSEAQVV